MARSTRNPLSSIAIGSAAAGFGFSGGRSSWRWLEKNALSVLFLSIVIAGSGLATFYIRASSKRGFFKRLFLVWLPSLLLIAVSLLLSLTVGTVLGTPAVGGYLLIWQGIVFVIGAFFAQPVRNRTRKAHEISAVNQRFLENAGLREVGGREGTMIDEFDREIVVDDIRNDAIIFRVKGRRGVRSKILLDGCGRMVGYVPATHRSKRIDVAAS